MTRAGRDEDGTEPAFGPDDLRIVAETRLLREEAEDRREKRRRLSAARWVAILTLPAIAGAALVTLFLYPTDPPAWAQPALFSIMTAAIAFLFSDRDDGPDRRRR